MPRVIDVQPEHAVLWQHALDLAYPLHRVLDVHLHRRLQAEPILDSTTLSPYTGGMSHHWSLPRPYRRTGREVPCVICGSLVYRPSWWIRNGWRTVCSLKCQSAVRSKPRIGLFDRWNRRSAYIFGLLCSDGHVSQQGALSFTSLDVDLAQFVARCLGDRASINVYDRSPFRPAYKVHFWSRPTVEHLITLGLTPRKSLTLTWPDIPLPQAWDFLRGILDGDGTVDKARRIAFCTASSRFLDGLKGFLRDNGFAPRIRQGQRCWHLWLTVSESHRLASYLYAGRVPFALARKRDRLR